MGTQIKTSGGGAATGTANDFQQWMQQQFSGQPAATTNANNIAAQKAQIQANNALPVGIREQMLRQLDAQAAAQTAAHPVGGAPSAFQNAFNGMLNGQVSDPSGANAAIANNIAHPNTYQSPYQNQTFSGPNLSQLPTDLFAGQTGMANLSGIPGVAQSKFDTSAGMGVAPTSQYTNILNSILGQGSSMASNPMFNPGSASAGPGVSLDPATVFDMNNPYFAALKDQQARALQAATADNNARFGAQGAGAIGSGAQLSNSNLQANAGSQNTIALNQAVLQQMAQDLAERGTRANVALGSRGQDTQLALGNLSAQTQAGLAGQNNQNSILQALLGAAGSARGQDFSAQSAARGQDIQQLGLGNDQSMFNAAQSNAGRGIDINALLQNQQQGNTFGLGAAGLNSSNMQANNSNQMDLSQLLNNFNLNNANQSANFQGSTNALNSNNLLQMLGLGQGTNGMANGNIQQMIQLLFGGGQQASQLGIPQAQQFAQPSQWGQVAQTGLGVLGGPLGKALGGYLNGGK